MINNYRIFNASTQVDSIYSGEIIVESVFYGEKKIWPVFDPSAIPGLRLWLDASTGLYDSLSGGNIVSNQGGVVARWEDLSGNDFHATSTAGPTLSLDQVNGEPSLVFTGSNFFQLPSILNGTSATAFVVVRPALTGSDSGPLIGNIGPSNSHYPYRGNAIYDDFATTVRKDLISQPNGFFNWHLYNVVSAANDWRYIFNGSVHFATPTNTYTSGPQGSGPFIGRSTSGGIFQFVGAMAEIIVYNSALTQEQLDQVSEYLRQKYALPDPLPYHLLLEGPSSV
jgi:hypothetical protein